MKSTNTEDEIIDIVDDFDNVIGQKKLSEVHRNKISHVRVVNLFLFNSTGELWIPRRTVFKENFPASLDMSMGGHVQSGESYEEALQRETEEELGLDILQYEVRLLGYLTPVRDKVPAFMKVYEIPTDHTPVLNKLEFSEAFWLTPHEILERIKRGELAKPDLAKLVEMFYTDRISRNA